MLLTRLLTINYTAYQIVNYQILELVVATFIASHLTMPRAMIKKFLKWLRGPTEEEQMYAFLSQATDLHHLEALEREWFSDRRKAKNYVALYR